MVGDACTDCGCRFGPVGFISTESSTIYSKPSSLISRRCQPSSNRDLFARTGASTPETMFARCWAADQNTEPRPSRADCEFECIHLPTAVGQQYRRILRCGFDDQWQD